MQVEDDGKLPRRICPNCSQSVKDIATYFDVLATGQKRLRDALKEQVSQNNCTLNIIIFLKHVCHELQDARLRKEKKLQEINKNAADMSSILLAGCISVKAFLWQIVKQNVGDLQRQKGLGSLMEITRPVWPWKEERHRDGDRVDHGSQSRLKSPWMYFWKIPKRT